MNEKLSKKKLSDDIARVMQKNGVSSFQVNVNVARQKVKLPQNIMVFQTFAFLAATKLKPATNCVLMLLFSKSHYENLISMDVLTIAEALEYTEQTVISALKELAKNNIVIKIKHPNDKRRNDYFLNPIAAWKGNSYTRKQAISLIQKKQLCLFGIDSQERDWK